MSLAENLRQEFVSLSASLAATLKSKAEKERELSILTLDLATIRDQIKGARQATQENIAAQHSIREQMERLTSRGRDNTVREMANREDIANISAQFDGLRNAIAMGSGWTPEQEEQRWVSYSSLLAHPAQTRAVARERLRVQEAREPELADQHSS